MSLETFALEIARPLIEKALTEAGVPAAVADIVARALPKVVEIVETAVSSGKDGEAELKALLDAADLAADEAERAKFGP